MYKDIEMKRAASRKWYRENKKRSVELSTAWRKDNPEKYLAMRKKHYNKHKERLQAEAKIRGKNYYKDVAKIRRQENPAFYKERDRQVSARIYAKRKALLFKLRIDMGGKCSRCGYDKEPRILQFHHIKKNKIDNVGNILVMSKIITEAAKCILLCPNCHAIEHLL